MNAGYVPVLVLDRDVFMLDRGKSGGKSRGKPQ